MLEYNDQQILLGNSIPLPEEDVDDNPTDLETEKQALIGYWQAKILNAIGKENFQFEYEPIIREILFNVKLDDQVAFCHKILDIVKLVYDFEFSKTPVIETKQHIYDIYFFLEFLEYNNLEFLISIWKYVKLDLSTKSLFSVCFENPENIIHIIEEQLEIKQFSEFISDFLRTYIKDKLVNWFCLMSKKHETEIMIRLMEETKNG